MHAGSYMLVVRKIHRIFPESMFFIPVVCRVSLFFSFWTGATSGVLLLFYISLSQLLVIFNELVLIFDTYDFCVFHFFPIIICIHEWYRGCFDAIMNEISRKIFNTYFLPILTPQQCPLFNGATRSPSIEMIMHLIEQLFRDVFFHNASIWALVNLGPYYSTQFALFLFYSSYWLQAFKKLSFRTDKMSSLRSLTLNTVLIPLQS